MSIPTVVAYSLKKLNKNMSNFEALVSEMQAATAPSQEQITGWRSRWTNYVSIHSLYLRHLGDDMEAHGVKKVPGPIGPPDDLVRAVQRALWPEETAVSQEAS